MTASNTLRAQAGLRGVGLHTGEECEVVLKPAPVGAGITLITAKGEVPAVAENVVATNRGTVLALGDAQVSTVEHLLSALAGMGVDDALIEVSGPEIPACDGSALPFVEMIESAGVETREDERWHVEVSQPVWVSAGDKYVIAAALAGTEARQLQSSIQDDSVVRPGEAYRVTALISFAHSMIGEQSGSFPIDPATYKVEIAPARTFCTADEVDAVLRQGLGKGGSRDNVVVVEREGYSVPLRYGDEFLRHKILDSIGDLALVGRRLRAHVIAIKAGHELHVALAAKMRDLCASLRQGG